MKDFLNELAASELLFIVEGKNDFLSLKKLGVKRIMQYNGPLYRLIEKVSNNKKIVILTDLDKEGRKLYGQIAKGLSERGVIIDNYFREYIFKNTKVRQIEGLHSYFARRGLIPPEF